MSTINSIRSINASIINTVYANMTAKLPGLLNTVTKSAFASDCIRFAASPRYDYALYQPTYSFYYYTYLSSTVQAEAVRRGNIDIAELSVEVVNAWEAPF